MEEQWEKGGEREARRWKGSERKKGHLVCLGGKTGLRPSWVMLALDPEGNCVPLLLTLGATFTFLKSSVLEKDLIKLNRVVGRVGHTHTSLSLSFYI